jgi:hypothetical protein
MKRLGIVYALIVMGFVSSRGVADAATYYTSKSGSDSYSCAQAQSPSSAKASVNGGIACLTAGDVLLVRTGAYYESVVSGVPSGTSWSNIVRIAAYPGETVSLVPGGGNYVLAFTANEQYIEFDGIDLDGSAVTYDTFRIESWSGGAPHHIRLQNATLLGTLAGQGQVNSQPQVAIVIASQPNRQGGNQLINLKLRRSGANNDFGHELYISSSDNLIQGSEFTDFPGAGIQVYNGYGFTADRNVIRDNIVHAGINGGSGQRGWGIIVASGTGAQVYNNVVYDIPNSAGGSAGISVYSGASAQVYNNTVFGTAGQGIAIEAGASSAVVRNNISFGNASDYGDRGQGTTADHNLLSVNPMFASSSEGNFQLKNGSPAIDTGLSISLVAADSEGTTRPQGGAFDIGAFEFTGSGPKPGAPTNVQISLR